MVESSARRRKVLITLYCYIALLVGGITSPGFTATAFLFQHHTSLPSSCISPTTPSRSSSTARMEESPSACMGNTSTNDPPRRSKRIRDSLLRRSSSLGEESGSDHFEGGDDVESKKMKATKRKDTQPPLFQVGLLADIQYAPIPDGYSYTGVPRYYQNALQAARIAASKFENDGVDLVVNLG